MLSCVSVFFALALTVPARLYSVNGASATDNAKATITAAIGSLNTGVAGSIVKADACDTTIALACIDVNGACVAVIGNTVTVTQRPTAYQMRYAMSTHDGTLTITESCDFAGSPSITRAICSAALTDRLPGESRRVTSTVKTFTDPSLFGLAQIPITAGASKLPSGSASCTISGDLAAPSTSTGTTTSVQSTALEDGTSTGRATPSSSGNTAGSVRVREVYQIMVPVGAAVAAACL